MIGRNLARITITHVHTQIPIEMSTSTNISDDTGLIVDRGCSIDPLPDEKASKIRAAYANFTLDKTITVDQLEQAYLSFFNDLIDDGLAKERPVGEPALGDRRSGPFIICQSKGLSSVLTIFGDEMRSILEKPWSASVIRVPPDYADCD